MDEYGGTGQVRFEFGNMAFLREDSGWAAEAALCANDQGAFWPYHDILFANQGTFSKSNLKQYAEMLGLEAEAFDECLDSGRYAEEVQNQLAEARGKEVTSTPTLFINGLKAEGVQPFENLKEIIEQLLASSS